MRNKSRTSEEMLPNIVQKKLERYKIEGRLINKKNLELGNYVTVFPKENIGIRKINVTAEVLNYTDLKTKPVIPRYGMLHTEILKVSLTDTKGIEIQKKGFISCIVKSSNIDKYCYPLLFKNDSWGFADKFSVERDGILISDDDWEMVIIIKEQPNEIITISPEGGMMYSELDKVTSLRIPKGNFHENKRCKLQFVNVSDGLEDFRLVYKDQLTAFENLSQIFVVQLIDQNWDLVHDVQILRRVITVKIPLPEWVISSLNDINFDTKKTIQDQKKEKLGFYFLQKISDNWTFFDGHLKFTQNSLGFETKQLGCYIFVKCRENREIRLCAQMKLVEDLQLSERGIILMFLWIKGENWYLWIELVPVNQISAVRESMQKNGLLFIQQFYEYPVVNQNSRGRRQSQILSKTVEVKRKTIDLCEGVEFLLSIGGEIERLDKKTEMNNNHEKESDEEADHFDRIGRRRVTIVDPKDDKTSAVDSDLSYHRNARLSNSILIPIRPIQRSSSEWSKIILDNLNKRSLFESAGSATRNVITLPVSEEEVTDLDVDLIKDYPDSIIDVTKLSEKEKEFNFLCEIKLDLFHHSSDIITVPTQKYRFYIPTEVMKKYFQVLTKEEEEELENERLKSEQKKTVTNRETDTAVIEEPSRPRMVDYRRIDVLSNPRVRKAAIERDSKIISTKSMQALSSVIRQGLTLAVYLCLPDNVIAGIGFDSMCQVSMNGVNGTTYKVLVTWKRMIHVNKVPEDVYVEQLMDAIKMLGYGKLSLMIYDLWKSNQFITLDDCQRCLLMNDKQ